MARNIICLFRQFLACTAQKFVLPKMALQSQLLLHASISSLQQVDPRPSYGNQSSYSLTLSCYGEHSPVYIAGLFVSQVTCSEIAAKAKPCSCMHGANYHLPQQHSKLLCNLSVLPYCSPDYRTRSTKAFAAHSLCPTQLLHLSLPCRSGLCE